MKQNMQLSNTACTINPELCKDLDESKEVNGLFTSNNTFKKTFCMSYRGQCFSLHDFYNFFIISNYHAFYFPKKDVNKYRLTVFFKLLHKITKRKNSLDVKRKKVLSNLLQYQAILCGNLCQYLILHCLFNVDAYLYNTYRCYIYIKSLFRFPLLTFLFTKACI